MFLARLGRFALGRGRRLLLLIAASLCVGRRNGEREEGGQYEKSLGHWSSLDDFNLR